MGSLIGKRKIMIVQDGKKIYTKEDRENLTVYQDENDQELNTIEKVAYSIGYIDILSIIFSLIIILPLVLILTVDVLHIWRLNKIIELAIICIATLIGLVLFTKAPKINKKLKRHFYVEIELLEKLPVVHREKPYSVTGKDLANNYESTFYIDKITYNEKEIGDMIRLDLKDKEEKQFKRVYKK